ncbi:MAG TPA: hypothetical protein DDW52_12480 [Planctomycetaceae bacterium]|nr:hypothetical protein [Planctomycetaceae bacterium]
MLGLLPIVTLEVGLRIAGYRGTAAIDPYVDLHRLEPLFVSTGSVDDYQQFAIDDSRLHLFRLVRFKLPKPEKTYRVFALGGSTTQGEPFSTETAFPMWLQIRLRAMLPSRTVEVINCGGLSYASYRVRAICEEVLEYEPDLIVVYTAHNEYLEKRSYASNDAGLVSSLLRWPAANLRSAQWLGSRFRGSANRRQETDFTMMQREVDALLDYQNGLEDYRRSDTWMSGVVEHFAWNVQQMVEGCRRADVPIVFCLPVANELDCPPMKYELSPVLADDDVERFTKRFENAVELNSMGKSVEAMEQAMLALELDPQHAGCLFLLGRLAYAAGDFPAAERYLQAAIDNDVCPLRATSEIEAALSLVLETNDVAQVDAGELFAERSKHGIVGDQWLVDHIHPSVAGHQLLGETIADTLVASGQIKPEIANSDWQDREQDLRAAHLSTLGEDYYHRGKQRLQGLRLWTQGRAKKLRITPDTGLESLN